MKQPQTKKKTQNRNRRERKPIKRGFTISQMLDEQTKKLLKRGNE